MNATTLSIPSPKITILKGTLNTTSLNVAEVFGRQHRNVTQKIENLDCSENFATANFLAGVKPIKTNNGGTKQIKVYNITRDGFTFLAMGFTGKKAAQFKEAYIAAFNQMEQELTQHQPSITSQPLTPDQQRTVQEAVNATGQWRNAYSKIKTHFRVGTYKDIPSNRCDEVLAFIKSLDLKPLSIETKPKAIEAEPTTPSNCVTIDRDRLTTLIKEVESSHSNLAAVRSHILNMADMRDRINVAIEEARLLEAKLGIPLRAATIAAAQVNIQMEVS